MVIDDVLGIVVDSIGIDNIPGNAKIIVTDSFPEFNNIAGAILKEYKEINQFNGLVRMTYDKGLGVLQRAKTGGYNGNIVGVDNKIVGHVKLEDISKAAAVTGSVMTVMSVITSQYYLHEINNSLGYIQSKVDKIGKYLEIDKRNHIASRIHYILDVHSNLLDIQNNDVEKQSVLTQLQQIGIEAYSDYLTTKDLIPLALESIEKAKNLDEIIEIINQLENYITQLWCSLYLYVFSKYLQMVISGTVDKTRITNLYNELVALIKDYEYNFLKFQYKSHDLIENHNAFKVNEVLVGAAKTIGNTASIPGVWFKNKAIDGIKEKIQDNKDEDRRTAICNLLDIFYNSINETEPIKKICEDIRFYNILYNDPVSFVIAEDEIYIVHGDC